MLCLSLFPINFKTLTVAKFIEWNTSNWSRILLNLFIEHTGGKNNRTLIFLQKKLYHQNNNSFLNIIKIISVSSTNTCRNRNNVHSFLFINADFYHLAYVYPVFIKFRQDSPKTTCDFWTMKVYFHILIQLNFTVIFKVFLYEGFKKAKFMFGYISSIFLFNQFSSRKQKTHQLSIENGETYFNNSPQGIISRPLVVKINLPLSNGIIFPSVRPLKASRSSNKSG